VEEYYKVILSVFFYNRTCANNIDNYSFSCQCQYKKGKHFQYRDKKYLVCFFLLLHFKQNQLRFSKKGSPALSWYFKQNKKKLTKVLNRIKINLLIIKGR